MKGSQVQTAESMAKSDGERATKSRTKSRTKFKLP